MARLNHGNFGLVNASKPLIERRFPPTTNRSVEHLAPTERRPLSSEGLSTQKAIRATRQEMARISNMSEGQVAARSLSPTIAAFFDKLRPYGESKESTPIDIKALYADWRDAYDAQSLLAEIEGRELVEVNQDGQLVVSQLGKEALALLREDYGY